MLVGATEPVPELKVRSENPALARSVRAAGVAVVKVTATTVEWMRGAGGGESERERDRTKAAINRRGRGRVAYMSPLGVTVPKPYN